MLVSCFALVIGLALSLPAGATELQRVKGGHIPAAAARLAAVGDLPGSQRLNLAIGLPLRNQPELDTLLRELYDPASPNYRRYLTPEQFAERFGPAEADYQALMDFAKSNHLTVTATHPNRVVLDVAGTVTEVQQAFHLTLRAYRHPRAARDFYAPDVEPSVNLGIPILHISGLDNYSLPRPNFKLEPASLSANATPKGGSGPSGAYRGGDFRTAYVPGTSLTGAGQTVGLLQFDGYYASDIATYASQAGLTNIPLTNVPINGGVTNPGNDNGEVCLDIEMAMSMAPGLAGIYVYIAPNPSPWVDLLNRMATDNLSKQLSCSWGGGFADETAEQIFQQMAAQGQSFFNATGDSDAYTGAIEFPSDSTNITQVGGTTLTTGTGAAYLSEKVWNWGSQGSSGGISTDYAMPYYQQGVSMAANQGSTTMRNVPDVALTAENVYVVYSNGRTKNFGGTSCAAPLWAGFTALVNQQAVASGRAAVGFLNPALYTIGCGASYTANFHDITTGNNFSSSSPTKFSAVPGYDLCTGWGTPNGTNLINTLAGPPILVPFLVSNSFALVAEGCTNGVVDPDETVSMSFGIRNIGTADTTNLVATLVSGGGVLSPGDPQTYGVLVANGAAVSQPFSFTATGICGGTNIASLQLQDGAVNLGTLTFSYRLGQPSTASVFSQDFDGVTAPALPAGWTTASTNAQSNWVTSTAARDTTPNSAFSPDPASSGVNELDSPTLTLPAGALQLTFRHNYNLESGYDGGVLDIKIGSGTWTDIVTAGGSFVSGGYISTLPSSYGNPLAGRLAWTGNSGGFISTVVNLPPAASGQVIRLRWRCGSDSNTGTAGWYVDTVAITTTSYVCCTASTDLAVTLSAAPDPVLAGQNLSYTLSVANLGPASASSVTLTDALPDSVTFVSASPGCVNLGGAVVCSVGTLPSGSATNFTVVVTPWAGGLITNTLTVASPTPDPDPTNNIATLLTTVDAPPTITVQPNSQAVLPDANVVLQVTAAGTAPLGFQWRFNGTNLDGAAAAALTIPNVQIAQAGSYTVLVTNAFGSTLSSNAIVTVLDPWIVAQPKSLSVAAGTPAAFTVSAVGAPTLSYQWLKETIALVDGTNISGAHTATLMLAQVQAEDMGNYAVVVSNAQGSMTSSNALLTVWPLLGWGSDDYSQADIPGGLTNVAGISAGMYHSLAVGTDGTVTAWGAGTTDSGTLPNYGQASVPDGLSNVVAVAAGFYHSLAWRVDGTVVAWGAGATNSGVSPYYGQAMVPAGLSNVVAVAAGAYHSLALKSDGTVAAWGAGTTNTGVSPDNGQALVPAGLSNVSGVAAGSYHSLALKTDGTVAAWGANSFGQTNVPGGLTNVAAVAAGYAHSLALLGDGTVVAWGFNNAGQTNVPGGLSNVVAVAGGFFHSLALAADGTVVAWGSTNYNLTNIPAGLTNAVAIAGGSFHNLILESDGRPTLTVQPVSQAAVPGTTIRLLALAAGLQPLSYQWCLNGSDLVGATAPALLLSHLQPLQAGSYTVVITNAAGSVTSAAATLTVLGSPISLNASLVGQEVLISFPSETGLSYLLEYKHSLDDPAWTSLPPAVAGTGGVMVLQDTNTPADSRYYRLRGE